MNQILYIVLANLGFYLILGLQNWKLILHWIFPDKIIWMRINMPTGRIVDHLHFIKEESVEKVEYKYNKEVHDFYFQSTDKTKSGSKYYEYDWGNKFPKNVKFDMDTNLEIDYKQSKIRYADFWIQDKDWREQLMEKLPYFIFGIILGAMIMLLYNQQMIKNMGMT